MDGPISVLRRQNFLFSSSGSNCISNWLLNNYISLTLASWKFHFCSRRASFLIRIRIPDISFCTEVSCWRILLLFNWQNTNLQSFRRGDSRGLCSNECRVRGYFVVWFWAKHFKMATCPCRRAVFSLFGGVAPIIKRSIALTVHPNSWLFRFTERQNWSVSKTDEINLVASMSIIQKSSLRGLRGHSS